MSYTSMPASSALQTKPVRAPARRPSLTPTRAGSEPGRRPGSNARSKAATESLASTWGGWVVPAALFILQRSAVGFTLLLLAACTIPIQTVTFKGTRTERFLYGVAYYQKLSGDNHRLVFEEKAYPGHPDYCAWVVMGPDSGVVVGLNNGNPRCLELKPEWLSLHEVCHLRMQHTSLPFSVSMPHDQKEREVAECMKGYDARRGK